MSRRASPGGGGACDSGGHGRPAAGLLAPGPSVAEPLGRRREPRPPRALFDERVAPASGDDPVGLLLMDRRLYSITPQGCVGRCRSRAATRLDSRDRAATAL